MARLVADSAFTRELETRARALARKIAFPEADDPRVVEAAVRLARRATVTPVLVGRRDRVRRRLAARGGAEGVEVVATSSDSLARAVGLLCEGSVDGVVAGAVRTSAEVIRAGLKRVGLRAGVKTLSSCFFMEVNDFRGRGAEVLTFTDAGVVPDPGARALAEIAREAIRVRRLVVGDEPRVAFLSYSTLGSARGRSVDRVRDSLKRFRAGPVPRWSQTGNCKPTPPSFRTWPASRRPVTPSPAVPMFWSSRTWTQPTSRTSSSSGLPGHALSARSSRVCGLR